MRASMRTIDYLDSEALFTRRGKHGTKLEHAKGVYALCPHGTSRSQDPQLHCHAAPIINLCLRQDGTTGAIRSWDLYNHKMAAGAIFRLELAYLLAKNSVSPSSKMVGNSNSAEFPTPFVTTLASVAGSSKKRPNKRVGPAPASLPSWPSAHETQKLLFLWTSASRLGKLPEQSTTSLVSMPTTCYPQGGKESYGHNPLYPKQSKKNCNFYRSTTKLPDSAFPLTRPVNPVPPTEASLETPSENQLSESFRQSVATLASFKAYFPE